MKKYVYNAEPFERTELVLSEEVTIGAALFLPPNQRNLAHKLKNEELIEAIVNTNEEVRERLLNETTAVEILVGKVDGKLTLLDYRQHDAARVKRNLARKCLNSVGFKAGWVLMAVKVKNGFATDAKYIRSGPAKTFDPQKTNLAKMRKFVTKDFGDGWVLMQDEILPNHFFKNLKTA